MSRIVGEIALFGGDFAPRGWLLCDGSVLNIASYRSLFEVIGTAYGGDGVSTFGLPDIEGPYMICYSGCVPTETDPAWGGLPLPGGGGGDGSISGVYTGSTNSIGTVSIPHGLAAAPTTVLATYQGDEDHAYMVRIYAINSLNIIFLVCDMAGIEVASAAVIFHWMAIP